MGLYPHCFLNIFYKGFWEFFINNGKVFIQGPYNIKEAEKKFLHPQHF
jgi:hypothetical protein